MPHFRPRVAPIGLPASGLRELVVRLESHSNSSVLWPVCNSEQASLWTAGDRTLELIYWASAKNGGTKMTAASPSHNQCRRQKQRSLAPSAHPRSKSRTTRDGTSPCSSRVKIWLIEDRGCSSISALTLPPAANASASAISSRVPQTTQRFIWTVNSPESGFEPKAASGKARNRVH
jgi:hypothetical protein